MSKKDTVYLLHTFKNKIGLRTFLIQYLPLVATRMSPLLIVILTLLVVYKLYRFVYDKPPNTPPGLIRIPIGGSYWLLLWRNYKYVHLALDYYAKKLKSKLFSCYFGDYFVVIANDYANIKEIFSREEFDGRVTSADYIKDRAFKKELGIFFIEGPQWQEQRRFALRHMRDFGFGRRQDTLESEVMDEMTLFIDILKNEPIYDEEKKIIKGNLALFPDILYASAANNIWTIMFGYRFNRSEHDILRHLCRSALMMQRANDPSGGALFQRPILKHFGNMFGYKNHITGSNAMIDVVKKALERQKATLSENVNRGFVDIYLKKLNEDDKSPYFTEEQLIILLIDMMFPAYSAVPTAITHAIKYLMHHPEIMNKVQNEIDSVVGTGRLVTWADRINLPYTEAAIRESLRIETLAPLGIIHKTMKKTTLGGYNIPANTPVIANLAAMNNDPDMWGDPENFRPERFLKEDGQLSKDLTLTFGFGHRLCAGETFARFNMFETIALLLQTFNFSFVDGEPSSLDDKVPGLIISPKELWLRLELR
ncbi:probable cytochrome P450 304a1 [Anoplolepis gracilipes]|uniref:probable cytochrome P450 304a1 n=1 Tax=Anoplolepis gracilipes TaxID=354296 RepID=UPI003B9E0A76